MNCTQARDRLLAWQYGELAEAERAEVEKHLANCAACREELSAWQGFRRKLEAFRGPAVQVDVPRLYQQASERQERRLRRWRRAALAMVAAAAVALIAVGFQLEIRVEAKQVVVRWGGQQEAQGEKNLPFSTPPIVPSQDPTPQVTAEDLQLVKDLIRALAREVQTRDRQQQEALLRLQTRLESLWGRANDRLTSNQRDVAALYTAFYRVPKKGEKP